MLGVGTVDGIAAGEHEAPHEDDDERRAAVMQALGAASMCWERLENAGEFDAEEAISIGEELLEKLDALDFQLQETSPEELLARGDLFKKRMLLSQTLPPDGTLTCVYCGESITAAMPLNAGPHCANNPDGHVWQQRRLTSEDLVKAGEAVAEPNEARRQQAMADCARLQEKTRTSRTSTKQPNVGTVSHVPSFAEGVFEADFSEVESKVERHLDPELGVERSFNQALQRDAED